MMEESSPQQSAGFLGLLILLPTASSSAFSDETDSRNVNLWILNMIEVKGGRLTGSAHTGSTRQRT